MKKQLIICLLLTSLFSQTFRDLTERPIYNPQKISNPITLDGSLSENEWQTAQVATNFVGTGLFQGIDSPLNTEVKVLYDDKYLYVGFKAFVDKSELRYSLTKRDNLDKTDDRVWINIDAFDDESLTYGLGVSAANVQIDGRDGFGFDQSLDLIYETNVKIYDDRYEVEMAIPFSSLRYSVAEIQTWRINFGRGFTGNDELTRYVYWASKIDGIECQTCQLGYLKDFSPAKQERGDIEYIPSIVATHSDNFLNNTSSSTDEASIFVKYPISSVDLLEIALNPDFSQIESDDIQTNVNTVNALYFPERRPFFSQGAELFKFQPQRGYINLFYSRTINDPSIVGKYTGKIGKTSYGVISARDESSPLLLPFEESSTIVDMGKSTSNIIRLKRMIANGGSIGGIITNRRFDGAGDMTTGGIDFHYHPGLNLHLTLHATASIHNESNNGEYQADENDTLTFDKYTKAFDGEKVSGNALGFSLSRFNRTDSSGITVRLRSPGFRTSNGFEKNNATKWLKMSKGKNIYWNKLSTEVSESDLKAFLFSSVFGALLIQRNFLLLHGNALIKNKRLIICLGKSGAGKSTISYILMKNGWKLISDDLVAIDDLMNVSIGIQRIKLWQDTLEMFNIENHNLERVRSKINKYIIPKKNLKLANSTSPIYSIFIVYSQDDYLVDPTISDALKIDSEKAKFFLIKDNIFRPRFAKGLQKESLYFKKIISLMKKVPLFLLPIPNNLSKMEDFIIEKFNKNHLT